MDLSRVDWEQQPWRLVRPGVERKSFSGQGATLALHRLMPGHEPRPHSHPHEQIAYILAGTLRFHIGGEQHLVGPGGVIAIPGNVQHWGEVVGDQPVLNLDVFTPRRPDYD
jgi:quercetin dioxygenase-like cupin family protein